LATAWLCSKPGWGSLQCSPEPLAGFREGDEKEMKREGRGKRMGGMEKGGGA